MSGPAYVVVPVNGAEGGEQTHNHDQIASAIERSLKNGTAGQASGANTREPGVTGPLGNIIDNSDSLYRYISWESPAQTLGAFAAAIAVLFGAHYIPWTQFALKAVATALGAVSVLEFAGRSFSSNTVSARLRPEGGYKKIPDSTLNATLRDVHDLIQATVVHIQKIAYGEDLSRTFTAFLAATGLFWLIKIVSPFTLAVLAVISVFLTPLVNSPAGRETARAAKQRGVEVASAAVQNGQQLARDGQTKAAELSSAAQQSATQAGRSLSGSVSTAAGTASDVAGQLASSAQGTAAQAKDYTNSSLSSASNVAVNASHQAHNTAAYGTNKASQLSGSAAQSARNITGLDGSPDSGHGFDTDSNTSEYPGKKVSFTTGHALDGGRAFGDVDEEAPRYIVANSQVGTQGIMNRSRDGVALAPIAQAEVV